MQQNPSSDVQSVEQAPSGTEDPAEDLAVTESLIEEVSIDGMCGVY